MADTAHIEALCALRPGDRRLISGRCLSEVYVRDLQHEGSIERAAERMFLASAAWYFRALHAPRVRPGRR